LTVSRVFVELFLLKQRSDYCYSVFVNVIFSVINWVVGALNADWLKAVVY
jgi:hypothetical protein